MPGGLAEAPDECSCSCSMLAASVVLLVAAPQSPLQLRGGLASSCQSGPGKERQRRSITSPEDSSEQKNPSGLPSGA